ncbi:2-succinyl-5-enolpyruvyl-6-hydroxy-3-cyclohexene-1-carboxylic-acid synthase [Bacillus testis]|uniref:2-succinyl-5-enolpyruvyl-6-hydroxy-3- cyclohexene-1-carboxylic-acid synthase n=1 Tax=Bacillus testis TaxID=1622072 RepID=UPI00067EC167|nr:2-succinyl-5-enolpyruvyl-6-hydroxy-3-cyclohexene-1-carboxylic-acid synthase [Bacillus testis]
MNHQEILTVYTSAFVDELARMKVKHAVISPGSRSTPISLLFTKHPDINIHINIDERSAGFYALGIAKASREPVALVCTSGTAAANYYPAVVEAYYSRVPLIVITADRPHELRDVGAPQAIDQLQLYGRFAKWFCEMSLPGNREEDIRYVRNIAKRASATAKENPAGPVHLNFPVREPLLPDMQHDYFTQLRCENIQGNILESGILTLTDSSREKILSQLSGKERGLIVVGEGEGTEFAAEVKKLAETLQYPILADPLSQLRTAGDSAYIVDCYDTFLRVEEAAEFLKPEIIIRLGAMPVSKPLLLFMKAAQTATHIVVDGGSGWREPTGMGTYMVHCDETAFCRDISGHLADNEPSEWISTWQTLNAVSKNVLQTLNEVQQLDEGKVFLQLNELLPAGAALFVGNSMPIRDCDTFFHNRESNVRILANRGANGIDGVVSTAIGVSVHGQPTVLVIGDLSFFHDMNGLMAAKLLQRDITIVIVNNDGGGIFSFLPQSSEREYFEMLFGTPHGLDFSHAIAMYGGQFSRVKDWEQFRKAMAESLENKGLNVVEVVTNRQENVDNHRKLWNVVSQEIKEVIEGKKNVLKRS